MQTRFFIKKKVLHWSRENFKGKSRKPIRGKT